MKTYRFKLHYNKPASQLAAKVQWSVHYRGKCYIVDSIECIPSTETKTNTIQPFAVMQGFTVGVEVVNNKAIIL